MDAPTDGAPLTPTPAAPPLPAPRGILKTAASIWAKREASRRALVEGLNREIVLRVLVLGGDGVGKSSLIRALGDSAAGVGSPTGSADDAPPTLGLETSTHLAASLGGVPVYVQLVEAPLAVLRAPQALCRRRAAAPPPGASKAQSDVAFSGLHAALLVVDASPLPHDGDAPDGAPPPLAAADWLRDALESKLLRKLRKARGGGGGGRDGSAFPLFLVAHKARASAVRGFVAATTGAGGAGAGEAAGGGPPSPLRRVGSASGAAWPPSPGSSASPTAALRIGSQSPLASLALRGWGGQAGSPGGVVGAPSPRGSAPGRAPSGGGAGPDDNDQLDFYALPPPAPPVAPASGQRGAAGGLLRRQGSIGGAASPPAYGGGSPLGPRYGASPASAPPQLRLPQGHLAQAGPTPAGEWAVTEPLVGGLPAVDLAAYATAAGFAGGLWVTAAQPHPDDAHPAPADASSVRSAAVAALLGAVVSRALGHWGYLPAAAPYDGAAAPAQAPRPLLSAGDGINGAVELRGLAAAPAAPDAAAHAAATPAATAALPRVLAAAFPAAAAPPLSRRLVALAATVD